MEYKHSYLMVPYLKCQHTFPYSFFFLQKYKKKMITRINLKKKTLFLQKNEILCYYYQL